MNLLNVTYKDLQVFIRDRGSVFTLFLLPFIFILVLSLATQGIELGASSAAEKPAGLPLTVVNNDPQGKAALSKGDIEAHASCSGRSHFQVEQCPFPFHRLIEDLEVAEERGNTDGR